MFSAIRPSLEVVKEGRIFYAGLVVIPTNYLQLGSGQFWDIFGVW
jgi:hypothetical protein